MLASFWDYFTDPVLRAPTIGSMLMCLASSLVGVVAFLRKRSLLGEALSHASYPGVVLSVLFAAMFLPNSEEGMAISILVGAFISSLIGLLVIDRLERKLRVTGDAALCLVLSVFFGVGILIASRIQVTHALWYKQIQVFLYGQAATMTDIHIIVYGVLAAVIILFLFFLYHPIEVINFDRDFAKSIGTRVRFVDNCLFLLLSLAIVIGIRSVGVVLMSGMLIAPAVAARQWTHRLSLLFILAGIFGLFSGFLGNYFSISLPLWVTGSAWKFSLPTGPMILITASLICFFSLFFAPKRGLASKFLRLARFKDRCLRENLLKTFWKKGEAAELSFREVVLLQNLSWYAAAFLLWRLLAGGWIETGRKGYRLTSDGRQRAARIIRLHRLWEVYLVDYLGQGVEKVHKNAEEMEHLITPELEKQLTELLKHPKQDPHQQPIPPREGFL